MTFRRDDALLVIDMQHDFLPGGALAVPDGHVIIPAICDLARRCEHLVVTQDWHPAGHVSFASAHGKAPFETVDAHYGQQTLWPDHCVRNGSGAALAQDIEALGADLVLRKGARRHVDSYSAFCEADRTTPTGLAGYLRERGVTRVVCVGLATDFCVASSALDAIRAGFETQVILHACRGIDVAGSLSRSLAEMAAAGVAIRD